VRIEPGQQLLHYRLTEKIGEGGMGVVWKAVDTTLDRDVAVKLLPDGFAADPERLARFEREAKLLASLNHPNVASIYGIHQVPEGAHFLAMELIDGEDLQQRMARGGLPAEDALRIAFDIAEGFEAAHARGVIHRDLKPANVKLTGDGGVKVLDFGLAKAMTPEVAAESTAPSMSPTMTSVGSVVGMILGTASYMSPEQAKGKQVDRRADIWSFGVVLFELLSGRRLFEGESVAETLAAVLTKEPDWSALPTNTPAKVRRLLQRCLTRDPKNRLQDIGDARIALQEVLAGDTEVDAISMDVAGSRQPRAVLPWLGVGVLLGLGLAWGVVSFRAPAREGGGLEEVVRFTVPAPPGVEKMFNPVVAQDGRYVVYSGLQAGKAMLYRHDFESGEARPLEGTEDASIPFLSPDGRWVGFSRRGELAKLRLDGGDAVKVCDVPGQLPGATWGPDDTILFPQGWLSGLWRVSADGGDPVQLTTVDVEAGEKGHWWPRFLPDGRHALFTIWAAGAGLIDSEVALLDVRTGEYRKLVRGSDARYLAPGYLVFYHAGSYHAIAFDSEKKETKGDAITVIDNAFDPIPEGNEEWGVTVSADRGTLAYTTYQVYERTRFTVLEPGLAPRTLAFPASANNGYSLSPDGRTIAVSSLESGAYAIHLLDMENGTDQRVSLTGSNHRPIWKPDGSGFTVQKMRKGDFDIYFKDVTTGGVEQPIQATPTDEVGIGWTVDGTGVIVVETLADGSFTDKVVSVDGASEETILGTSLIGNSASFSPDGDWLAYDSSRTGANKIYVRPYPGPGAEVLVSADGGKLPAWSPDGSELYYVENDGIVAVPLVNERGQLRPGKPEVLFESPLLRSSIFEGSLGVLGQRRFVVPMLESEPKPPHLKIVLNWDREVAARFEAD
jgi:serine/threonine-protein kinase